MYITCLPNCTYGCNETSALCVLSMFVMEYGIIIW